MSEFEELGSTGWEADERPAWSPLEIGELRDLHIPHELITLDDGREVLQIGDVERAREVHEVQGHNDFGFNGTCGLAAIACELKLFGRDVSENDVVRLALETRQCSVTNNPFTSGGTRAPERVALLEAFGLPAHWEKAVSLEQVALHVERGEGVILGLNTGVLWNDARAYDNGQSNHAVAAIATLRDTNTGQLIGFRINDTASADGAGQFVDAQTAQAALVNASGGTGTIVVTDVSRYV